MSYDLNLFLEPPIDRREFLEHFNNRRNFAVRERQIAYANADTGVGFAMDFATSRGFLSSSRVTSVHVEVNYLRPSFFGIEAEIEVSALVEKFRPRIDDPQIKGMREGPYSAAGFLSGWNFGNEFSARTALDKKLELRAIPSEKLLAAWKWNYQKAERLKKVFDKQFVPSAMPVLVNGVPSVMVVWALGMPILLPKVEYVLVGRDDKGTKRYGLADWSEVLQVVKQACIDTEGDPLDLKYAETPEPIARWVASIPEVDTRTVPRLAFSDVIDDEVIVAARRMKIQSSSTP